MLVSLNSLQLTLQLALNLMAIYQSERTTRKNTLLQNPLNARDFLEKFKDLKFTQTDLMYPLQELEDLRYTCRILYLSVLKRCFQLVSSSNK